EARDTGKLLESAFHPKLTLRSSASQAGLRLPLGLGHFHLFAALGALSHRRPCRFGAQAALTHMLKRSRFRLRPGLGGTGDVEVEIAVAVACNHRARLSRINRLSPDAGGRLPADGPSKARIAKR